MSTTVKICGLTSPEGIAAAVSAGARYLGFVFFAKSPRHVTPEQAAALAAEVPLGIAKVGLFVNPDDALLQTVLAQVPLDMIQLHGSESPARVTEVRALTGLPVMKAVGVAEPRDLDALWDYGLVADMLLIDAKPPKDAELLMLSLLIPIVCHLVEVEIRCIRSRLQSDCLIQSSMSAS